MIMCYFKGGVSSQTWQQEAKRAVQKCCPNVFELLAISKLTERLYLFKLLFFDWKSRLNSLTLLEEKIKHLLDVILILGLNIDYAEHLMSWYA